MMHATNAILLFAIFQILFCISLSFASDIPAIFSAGESGGSIKFGLPWPKQSDSSNPITALTYSIDGMQQVKISLDGTESSADGTNPIVRKKKASIRLFKNFLRTTRERSVQRSSSRESTITCPKDMNIAMGFALQFSPSEDETTRMCMLENNKKCDKGATSCSTQNCAVISNYEGITNWDAASMRDDMFDTSLQDFSLAQTSTTDGNLGEIDALHERVKFSSNPNSYQSHVLKNIPGKYIGCMYLRGDYHKGTVQTTSFTPSQPGRMYLALKTPNAQNKAPSGFVPDVQDGQPIPKLTLAWTGSNAGTSDMEVYYRDYLKDVPFSVKLVNNDPVAMFLRHAKGTITNAGFDLAGKSGQQEYDVTYVNDIVSTASSRTQLFKLVSGNGNGATTPTRVAWSTAPTDVYTTVPQKLLGAVMIQTKGSDIVQKDISTTARWYDARTKCTNDNMRLCDWSEVCPRGELDIPHGGMESNHRWVPIGCGTTTSGSTGHNNCWVNTGNDDPANHLCKTYRRQMNSNDGPNWGQSTQANSARSTLFCCTSKGLTGSVRANQPHTLTFDVRVRTQIYLAIDNRNYNNANDADDRKPDSYSKQSNLNLKSSQDVTWVVYKKNAILEPGTHTIELNKAGLFNVLLTCPDTGCVREGVDIEWLRVPGNGQCRSTQQPSVDHGPYGIQSGAGHGNVGECQSTCANDPLCLAFTITQTLGSCTYYCSSSESDLCKSSSRTDVTISGKYGTSIHSNLECKPGILRIGTESAAYSTDSDCDAKHACVFELDENCQVRSRLLDRCKSARDQYAWTGFGPSVTADECTADVPPTPTIVTYDGHCYDTTDASDTTSICYSKLCDRPPLLDTTSAWYEPTFAFGGPPAILNGGFEQTNKAALNYFPKNPAANIKYLINFICDDAQKLTGWDSVKMLSNPSNPPTTTESVHVLNNGLTVRGKGYTHCRNSNDVPNTINNVNMWSSQVICNQDCEMKWTVEGLDANTGYLMELYTYSQDSEGKNTNFVIKTGSNQDNEIGAYKSWGETDMANSLTSPPTRTTRGYTTKPFQVVTDASGTITIWLIVGSTVNGWVSINGLKIEPAVSQKTATCIGGECNGWRLVAQEPATGQQGLAFLGSKFTPSQSSGFTSIKIRENQQCKSNDVNLGTFTGSNGLSNCAAACAAIGSCRFFIFGIGSSAGQCRQEKTASASCDENWQDASYDFYQLNELTATKIGVSNEWKMPGPTGSTSSIEFGPFSTPVPVGYYSMTSSASANKAVSKWVVEGKNSNTGWTLLDVTHETGNGGASWAPNEIRDYALNKDTTPAIWVFAGRSYQTSNGDYKKQEVGEEEFNALFASSKTKIFKFLCTSCPASTHQEIYYKRVTPMKDLNLYENVYTHWKDANNQINVDFKLYSSYENAINDQNKWSYCYSHPDWVGIGFPAKCGVTQWTDNNWIGTFNGNPGQQEYSIHIDSPDTSLHPWIKVVDTTIQTSSKTGGWEKFWWFKPMDSWPAGENDVFGKTYGDCADSTNIDYCFQRLSSDLEEATTELRAVEKNSAGQITASLKWTFNPNNKVAHAAWNAMKHGLATEAGSVKNQQDWKPTIETRDFDGRSNYLSTPNGVFDSFMYRVQNGVKSLLFGADNCECKTTLSLGKSMCNSGCDESNYCSASGYGVDTLLDSLDNSCSQTTTNERTVELYFRDTRVTVRSEGSLSIGKIRFDTMFKSSPEPKIIKRICDACVFSHKEIYYRRLTPVPEGMSMYDLLHDDRWSSNNNILGVDYDLYSNFGDAKVGRTSTLENNGSPYPWWEFCNYDNDGTKGWNFPGECRPGIDGATPSNQWGLSRQTRQLQNVGRDGCTSNNKCTVCQGNCDTDDDCMGSLQCKKRTKCFENAIPGCIQGGDGDNCDFDYCHDPTARGDGATFNYQFYIQTTQAVTKTECCTNYRIRSLEVQGASEVSIDMSSVQLYEELDNSDTTTQAFNLGPDLEHGADYNQVAVVWDGFDSSNKAKHFVSFHIDTHLFVDTVDATIEVTQVTTNNDQARSWFDNDGGATFCRATSLNDGIKPGGSSWGIIPKNSIDRTCGCHGVDNKGTGMFYGGISTGCSTVCGACLGGGWSGAVGNDQPHGKAGHTNQMVQFWVRMASTDNMDTSSPIVPTNWVGGGDVRMIRYGVKEAGGLGCLQDGMPGCEVDCSMEKGYTVGVAEQKTLVRLPGGENFIQLGNFRIGTTNKGDTLEIVHVSKECTGCNAEPKIFNGEGKTIMVFNKDGTREESSKSQMGEKIDLSCPDLNCGGAAGTTTYTPPNGLAVVTTSYKTYDNGNYYHIGYLFDGSSIEANNGDTDSVGNSKNCQSTATHTCYWLVQNKLRNVGGCTAANPCGKCEGDCNDDNDCRGDLKCFQRDSCVQIPGCYDGSPCDYDFCHDPNDALTEQDITSAISITFTSPTDIGEIRIREKSRGRELTNFKVDIRDSNDGGKWKPASHGYISTRDWNYGRTWVSTYNQYNSNNQWNWIRGFATFETKKKILHKTTTQHECAEAVEEMEPDANGAIWETNEPHDCYATTGWNGATFNDDYMTSELIKNVPNDIVQWPIKTTEVRITLNIVQGDYVTLEEIEIYRPKATKEQDDVQELWNKVRGFGGQSSGVVVGDEVIEFDQKWRICKYDANHMAINHINDGNYDKTVVIWRCDGRQYAGPRTDYRCGSKSMASPKNIGWGTGFIEFGSQWRIGASDADHLSIASTKCSTGHGDKDVSIVYRSDGAVLTHGEIAATNSGSYLCEGDCNSDNDCSGDWLCWQRNNREKIPGCMYLLYDTNSYDYCYNPSVKGDREILDKDRVGRIELYSPAHTMVGGARCEGQCESDADCRGKLICFVRGDTRAVPGCKGTGVSGWNYCIDPIGSAFDAATSTWDHSGAMLPHSLSGRVVTIDPIPRGIGAETSMGNQRNCGKWCDGKYLTYLADNGVGSGLPRGLAAYWPLDGNGDDSSMNGVHLSTMAGLQPRNNGKVRQAYGFQGPGSSAIVFDTGHTPGLDLYELTAAAWVYPLGPGKIINKDQSYDFALVDLPGKTAMGGICSNNEHCHSGKCGHASDNAKGCVNRCMRADWSASKAADWNCLRTESLVLKGNVWLGSATEPVSCGINGVGDALIAPNVWTHVAMTYDGTKMRMYVNSLSVYEQNCGSNVGNIVTSNKDFLIGATFDQDEMEEKNFYGRIDEVMLFDRALNTDELETIKDVPQPSCEFHPAGSIIGVPAGDGSSENSPGRDCQVLKVKGITSNGVYWIQPDDGVKPFQVYCDFTMDDGGWTLVYSIAGKSSMQTTEEYNAKTSLLDNDMSNKLSGKLSDNVLRSLCTEQYKVVQTDPMGTALVGKSSDWYCTFDDISKFGDDAITSKKCGAVYKSTADYETIMNDNTWNHGFSTWGTGNGPVVTQMLYNPGCLPEQADCSESPSSNVEMTKYYAQRDTRDSTSNGNTDRQLTFTKKKR